LNLADAVVGEVQDEQRPVETEPASEVRHAGVRDVVAGQVERQHARVLANGVTQRLAEVLSSHRRYATVAQRQMDHRTVGLQARERDTVTRNHKQRCQ